MRRRWLWPWTRRCRFQARSRAGGLRERHARAAREYDARGCENPRAHGRREARCLDGAATSAGSPPGSKLRIRPRRTSTERGRHHTCGAIRVDAVFVGRGDLLSYWTPRPRTARRSRQPKQPPPRSTVWSDRTAILPLSGRLSPETSLRRQPPGEITRDPLDNRSLRLRGARTARAEVRRSGRPGSRSFCRKRLRCGCRPRSHCVCSRP